MQIFGEPAANLRSESRFMKSSWISFFFFLCFFVLFCSMHVNKKWKPGAIAELSKKLHIYICIFGLANSGYSILWMSSPVSMKVRVHASYLMVFSSEPFLSKFVVISGFA